MFGANVLFQLATHLSGMPFCGREAAAAELVTWLDSLTGLGRKDATRIAACSAGPGTGKSRLLDELPKLLRESTAKMPRAQLVQKQLARREFWIQLNSTYGNGTFLEDYEKTELSYSSSPLSASQHSLARRLFYAAFDVSWPSVKHDPSITDPCSVLELVRDAMALKHSSTYNAENPLVVLIGLDEYQLLRKAPLVCITIVTLRLGYFYYYYYYFSKM